jgi:CheY-like chemotaxis protein
VFIPPDPGVFTDGSEECRREYSWPEREERSVWSFNVLVVDKSESFLASARHWFEARRDVHLVATTRTASSALEAASALNPDLVIVEALLPGIDGLQLTRALKSLPKAPLVVIVTTHASAASREEAIAAGADGYLAKDSFSGELDAYLEQWKTDRPPGGVGLTNPARPDPPESRTAPDP